MPRAASAARIARRLGDERGQDVLEYAGVLVLVAALIAAVASLGLGVTIANAVRCEAQRVEQTGCGASAAVGGGSAAAAARPVTEPRPVGDRRHQQAVHTHPVAASKRVPAALAQLQRDAAFFRTAKGSLVALALAGEIASQACDANDGDMLGPDFLCSGTQYASGEIAIYHALQSGQDVGALSLAEPSFDTNAGSSIP